MLLLLNKLSLSASFIVISVILTTIVVATIVGNLFVILAILMEKNLQTNANQLVLSLAVADLMVACLVMPLGAYNDIYQGWYLSKEMCEFWTSADVLCCTASILNLLAIALDRYWAVTNVDYIYKRTRQRVNMMILCAWTVGAIVSLAPIFGWKDPDFASRVLIEHKCMVSQDVAYQIFATISTFYAPLVLLLALYWRIFQVARKRIRRKPGQQQQQQLPNKHQPKQILPKLYHKQQQKQQQQQQQQQQKQDQNQRDRIEQPQQQQQALSRQPQLVGNQTPLSLLSATKKKSEQGEKEQLVEEISVVSNHRQTDYDKPLTEIVSLSSPSCCKSSSNVVVDLETINSISQISSSSTRAGLVFESSCAKLIGSICAPGFQAKLKRAKIGPREWEGKGNEEEQEEGEEKEREGGEAEVEVEEINSGGYIENCKHRISNAGKQYDKVQSNSVDLVEDKSVSMKKKRLKFNQKIASESQEEAHYNCSNVNCPTKTNLVSSKKVSLQSGAKLSSISASFVEGKEASIENERELSIESEKGQIKIVGQSLVEKAVEKVESSPEPVHDNVNNSSLALALASESGYINLHSTCLKSDKVCEKTAIEDSKANRSYHVGKYRSKDHERAQPQCVVHAHQKREEMCRRQENSCESQNKESDAHIWGDSKMSRFGQKSSIDRDIQLGGNLVNDSSQLLSSMDKISSGESHRKQQADKEGKKREGTNTVTSIDNTSSSKSTTCRQESCPCCCCCRHSNTCSASQAYCSDCCDSEQACLAVAATAPDVATTSCERVQKRAQINHRINCGAYLTTRDDRIKSLCKVRGLEKRRNREDEEEKGENVSERGNENEGDKKEVLASQCRGVISEKLAKVSEQRKQQQQEVSALNLLVDKHQERHHFSGDSREKGLKIDRLYKKTPTASRALQQLEDNFCSTPEGTTSHALNECSSSSAHRKQAMLSLSNNATCTQSKLGSLSSCSCSLNHQHCQQHQYHATPPQQQTKATSTRTNSLSNSSLEYMIESADVDGRRGARCRQHQCSCFECNADIEYEEDHEDDSGCDGADACDGEYDDRDEDYDEDDDDDDEEEELEDDHEDEDEDELSLSASFPPPIELCVSRLSKATRSRNPAERDDATRIGIEECSVETFTKEGSVFKQVSPSATVLNSATASALSGEKFAVDLTKANLNLNSRRHSAKVCAHSVDDKTSLSLFASSSGAQRSTTNCSNTIISTSNTKSVVDVKQEEEGEEKTLLENGSEEGKLQDGNLFRFPLRIVETTATTNGSIKVQRQNSTYNSFKRKLRAMGQLISFVKTSKNFYSSTTSGASSSNQSSAGSNFIQSTLNHGCMTSADVERATNDSNCYKKNGSVSFRFKRESNFSGGVVASGNSSVEVNALPSVSATISAPNIGASTTNIVGLQSQPQRTPTLIDKHEIATKKTNIKSNNTKNNNQNSISSLNSQKIVQIPNKRRENMDIKREKKAAKTLAIITGVFVCCWLPFFLNAIIMPICGPSCTPNDLILSVLLWLGYLNSLLNPIIYTIFSPDFRRAFRRLLCWPELVRLTGSTFKTSGKA